MLLNLQATCPRKESLDSIPNPFYARLPTNQSQSLCLQVAIDDTKEGEGERESWKVGRALARPDQLRNFPPARHSKAMEAGLPRH